MSTNGSRAHSAVPRPLLTFCLRAVRVSGTLHDSARPLVTSFSAINATSLSSRNKALLADDTAIYFVTVKSAFNTDRETRRRFLTRGAIGGPLALRALVQAQHNTPAIGLEAGEPTGSLVVQNITVIDGHGGPAMRGMTVSIAGDRIHSVGPTSRTVVPPGARIEEGRGKFLIPGLWDMHTHPNDGWMYPLFLANGITGLRIMEGYPSNRKLRAEISAGTRLGPRVMAIASPVLDGPPGIDRRLNPPWRIVSNAEQGRVAVRAAVQEGAEFIKVYELLSRDTYFAIADESQKQGVPFVGHIPRQMTPAECSMAGQKSIEHVFGIERACSEGYETWRQSLIRAANPATVPMLDLRGRLETFDVSRAAAIASVFRKNHTSLCPTLVTGSAIAGDPWLTQSPNLRYVGSSYTAQWVKSLDDPELPLSRRFVPIQSAVVGAMYKEGVGILAGTDTPLAYCVPGFAVHEELRFMVRAGLTPMDALRAATYKPAQFLGKLDSLGTVERNKFAELVLLDANPLDDIANTQKINMVISKGRMFRKPALEAMLQAAEARARK